MRRNRVKDNYEEKKLWKNKESKMAERDVEVMDKNKEYKQWNI